MTIHARGGLALLYLAAAPCTARLKVAPGSSGGR